MCITPSPLDSTHGFSAGQTSLAGQPFQSANNLGHNNFNTGEWPHWFRQPQYEAIASPHAHIRPLCYYAFQTMTLQETALNNGYWGSFTLPKEQGRLGLFLVSVLFAEEHSERAQCKNCNPCRTPVDTESKLGSVVTCLVILPYTESCRCSSVPDFHTP
ncbi:hypothetical protein Tco_0290832 [Tanacetum coccineum]